MYIIISLILIAFSGCQQLARDQQQAGESISSGQLPQLWDPVVIERQVVQLLADSGKALEAEQSVYLISTINCIPCNNTLTALLSTSVPTLSSGVILVDAYFRDSFLEYYPELAARTIAYDRKKIRIPDQTKPLLLIRGQGKPPAITYLDGSAADALLTRGIGLHR